MTENIATYVKTGWCFSADPKRIREFAFAPILLIILWGIAPGIILGDLWLILSFTMIFSSVLTFIVIAIMLVRELTVKKRLIMQGIIYLDWTLQFSLIQIVYSAMIFDFDFILIFICLPQIFTLLLLCIVNSKKLKKELYQSKNNIAQNLTCSFCCTGVLGILLARYFFENISQQSAIIFVIFICSLLASIFSCGMLSFQKLYYYEKYLKS